MGCLDQNLDQDQDQNEEEGVDVRREVSGSIVDQLGQEQARSRTGRGSGGSGGRIWRVLLMELREM